MIKLGLTGYPLGHSLSPLIHYAALEYSGLIGEYSLFPIHPDDKQGLRNLLNSIRSAELMGLNVTIPYKQQVIPLLDELTPTAKSIGAVNTIFLRNNKLIGENTDAPGFLADLKKLLSINNMERKKSMNALVLGAGGSARAVIYALLADNWNIIIAARRKVQAKELISQFPKKQLKIGYVDFTPEAFQSMTTVPDLVVNTTPVGMLPKIGESPWPDSVPLPSSAYYDLVYNPRETKFFHDAYVAKLKAKTGLGMLVEQAALAFEIWTGYNVPRETLFAAVEEI